MNYFSFKIVVVVLLFTSCTQTGSQVWKVDKQAKVEYDYSKPAAAWQLDNSMHEISGLGYDVESGSLLAVNDEKGNIYQIDKLTGEVHKLFDFSKGGDYEGIVRVEQQVFVLKSNGKLYRYDTDKGKTDVIDTDLSADNDAEGLCYEPSTHSILVACKGIPLNENKSEKAVYRYRLDTNTFDSDPALVIHLEELEQMAMANQLSAEQIWRLRRFSPSGIAIHPGTGAFYLLSARGSLLMVLSADKRIQHLVFLDMLALPQPEGITFDNAYHLYIASEGKSGKGKLLKYNAAQ
ncbi:SdiA-regulated domain-containing protein [Carboxylicivirga taeanensis]|uniref:SdiA-regulated domain-containing protein n=1 Tax=Carboxylicivirga taeanensis TaxID=1416875 RepID=UPI003F6DBF30